MTSTIDKHYRTQKDKEKQEKVDVVTAVEQMRLAGHNVMVARESPRGYSYQSFPNEAELHVWMSGIPDKDRHIYGIDLSAWHHKDASSELQAWASNHFVSPLYLEIEWRSNDHLPDPTAADKLAAVEGHMSRALECVGYKTVPSLSRSDTGGVCRKTSKYLNCYLVFAADVFFEDNNCMKDFIRKMLAMSALTGDPLMFQENDDNEQECIVHSRGTMLEMSGCCAQRGAGVALASLDSLRRFRNCLQVSEVNGQCIISGGDMSGVIIQDNNEFKEEDEKEKSREAGCALPRNGTPTTTTTTATATDTDSLTRRSASTRANNVVRQVSDQWLSYDVNYVTTGKKYKYMGEDPQCDPNTKEGLERLLHGPKLSVMNGHQGAGKTHCYLQMILALHLKHKKRVVLLTPNTVLACSLAQQLKRAAKDLDIRVRFYKDRVPPAKQHDWEVLVLHPMSLVHYIMPMDGKFGFMVLDELSSAGAQLTGWTKDGEVTNRRLAQAKDLMKCWASGAEHVMFCGAQIDEFEAGRMAALLEIDASDGVTWYRHYSRGPLTRIVPLMEMHQALNHLWDLYKRHGHRMAVYCRYAEDARHIADFLRRTAVAEKFKPPKVVVWTGQWLGTQRSIRPYPASNPTAYLTAKRPDVFLYTTALPPGSSLTGDLFTGRMIIAPDRGDGPGEKVIGQMANRVRDVSDRKVYMFAPYAANRKHRNADQMDNAVMTELVNSGGADTETVVDEEGKPLHILKQTLFNDLKLEEGIRHARGITMEGITRYMGNAVLSTNREEVMASRQPSLVSIAMAQERKERALNTPGHYCTASEIQQLVAKMCKEKPSEDVAKAARLLYIGQMLPPRFVKVQCRLQHSLSHQAFNLVDGNYDQFATLHRILHSVAHKNSMKFWEKLKRPFTQFVEEKSLRAMHAITHLATLSSLGVIQTNLTCKVLTCITSTDTKLAHKWVRDNWNSVNSLLSKRSTIPRSASVPEPGNTAAWHKYLVNVVKQQLGMGVRANRGAHKHTYTFIPGSLWKSLRIDMDGYTKWLLSDGPNTHTSSPAVMAPCYDCETEGSDLGPVESVFQGGVAKCTQDPSMHQTSHRNMMKPLDAGTTDSFTKRVAAMMQPSDDVQGMLFLKVVEPQPEPEPEETKMNAEFTNRVFKFMGFVDGIDSRKEVQISDVLASVARSPPLSVADQRRGTVEMQVSFEQAPSWTTVRQIGPVLRKIASKTVPIGTRIVTRGDPTSRVYFLQR